MILTSTHEETPPPAPIIDAPLVFAPVEVGAGCDIGIGAILLPGARIGAGAQVGAGAVVTGEVPDGHRGRRAGPSAALRGRGRP